MWNKYRQGKSSGRPRVEKAAIERVAKDRLIASKENLADPIREAVLSVLPISNENLLEDNSYLNIIDTFKTAGSNLKLCMLEYITAEMEFGTRLVEFYSFRKSLAGNVLVYGWSYKSNAIRSYRLDRVVSVMLTRVPYEPKWPVEIEF